MKTETIENFCLNFQLYYDSLRHVVRCLFCVVESTIAINSQISFYTSDPKVFSFIGEIETGQEIELLQSLKRRIYETES